MNINIFQKGFNYSQDGPGNRLVYHLQGCNMRCPWCSNPEGMEKEKRASFDQNLYFSCKTYTVDELIDEAKRSALLFYDGGGVTLTGGEVNLQWEAVYELLSGLKKENIHTAIESNASSPYLERLFDVVDYLIMDFKHYDDKKHKEVTGVSNKMIKENLIKAFHNHPCVLIHIPVIKGFNDTKEDAMNFISFLKEHITDNVQFEFLPYHEYGKEKWEKCGMAYTIKDGFVSPETILMYENLFKENDLKVTRT